MKKLQKGFTLVELIVVITILAILGTIAFISLQGYSQDAKNSKVLSDLSTLASAIEIANSRGGLTFNALVLGDRGATNGVLSGATDPGISIFSSTNVRSTGSLASSNYKVGTINFAELKQNGDEFKDPETKDYIVAIAYSGSTTYYQLAGQKKETSGTYKTILKGNYIAQLGDTAGFVSASGTTTPIANDQALASGVSLY